MAEDKALDEKERKRAEVRARLEAAAASKKTKKGFMTPARRKKLRVIVRMLLKMEEKDLKRIQEKKEEERKKTIATRCGPQKNLDGINEAELINITKEYHVRIAGLEAEKYDMEFQARHREYKINELNIQVNELRGKFTKPVLKKVSRFDYGKFEKLMGAAKKADNDFRTNLKSVGPSTKFKLEDDVKESKPEWAAGVKEAAKKGEE